MKKRLISMLLLVVMVLGMLPATALAASSEEEALGEVNIYNGEQKLSYLSINGRIRELIYTYFNYVGANGKTKEIPAYCVNPNTTGVPQTVAPGESIKYMAKEKGSDPKVMGIIANGYPTRGLSELKLENKYHAYYATKMALWCYLLPNWNINNLKVNPNLTGTELQRAQAILAAAKDIYVRGTAWSKVYSPRVTATADRDTAYAVTVNGQQYKQQVFTVHSDTWVLSFILIMTVYGRFFRLYMFTALAPLPLASFAGEDTSFMGKAFLRSYLGVCMEGAIVVLACLIFSAFAASGAPIADTSLPVVTMSWQYVAQTIFNMLILVALIKGAERIAKEMFGL